MIRNLIRSGTSVSGGACSTVRTTDIFGDNSGKALYRLDGNANDESGNYHGTETAITYGGGMYERGAVFNGSSSKIDLLDGVHFDLQTFSISLWVKFTTSQTNTTIFSNYNYSGAVDEYGFLLRTGTTANTIQFRTSSGATSYIASSTAAYNDGLWHNVVGVFSSNTIYLYIDGVFITSTVANTINYTTAMPAIGCRYTPSASQFFNGSIDQVRIFNRAITATEVATLYAECEPTSIVDNINPFMDGSLKALYKFDGDATDATGVYNGTATNVTYGTGKFGQCAVFNGTALISTSFALSANIFSYSIWASVTTVSSTIQSLIDFTTNRAMLSSGNGTNSYVSYYDGGTYRTFGAYSLPSNTRVFLTLVVNGTTSYLYADGLLKGTSTCTAIIPSGGMYLGRYAGSASGFLTGNLDQARLFNNKALTPMEVASLYNETTPLEEPMSALVDPFRDGSGKALYRLDGNALDESGNYNGTATDVTYGAGRFGRCGVFNGSSSKVEVSRIITNTQSFSISIWVNPSASTVISSGKMIFQSYDNDFIILTSGNNLFSFTCYDPSSNSYAISTAATASMTHVVGTFQLNGDMKLYTSGILRATLNFPFSSRWASLTTAGHRFGTNLLAQATQSFEGSIDQARIFNRALTQAEVSTLYTEGA